MGDGIHNKGRMSITESAVAIGSHARASSRITTGPSAPAEAQLVAELEELVERLRLVSRELADRDAVDRAADDVAAELARPATGWRRILDALRRVGPSVAALTGLATDVGRLETAVEALLPR